MNHDNDTIIELATQTPHANIIADLTGLSGDDATFATLTELNPSTDPDVLRDALRELSDADIIRYDDESETYHVTDAARSLFDTENLFPRAAWERQVTRVRDDE